MLDGVISVVRVPFNLSVASEHSFGMNKVNNTNLSIGQGRSF